MIEADEIVEMRKAGKTMAQMGYEAYAKLFQRMPPWAELSEEARAGWEAAAVELQRLRDAALMPAYASSRSAPAPTFDVALEHPPEPILQFFAYEHLPPALATISKPFCDMAAWIFLTLPRNAERTVAMRKLLEAKDAAVRASIAK